MTPKLRFPEFDGDWGVEKMENLFSHIRNGFVGIATPFYVSEGIKYLQGKNIKGGQILEDGIIYISTEFHLKSKKSVLKENDLLMVQSGHVGECAVVKQRHQNSNCHALLVATPQKDVLSDFYKYFFYSPGGKKAIHIITTGNTIKHILSSDLKNVIVPITSNLNEQLRIIRLLRLIDQRINLLTKKKEALETYKKGLMQKIFSQKLRFKREDGTDYSEWGIETLDKLCLNCKSGGTPKSTITEYYDGDIPFLAISDITEQGKYLRSTSKSISELGIENSASWIVPEQSLIYSMYASVGFVSINLIPLATSQAVLNLIVDERICLTEYLYYWLYQFQKNVHVYVTTGTQGNLNAQTVKSFQVDLPSIKEQEKIILTLSKIDEQIALMNSQIRATVTLKKGLLQQMFV